MRINGDIGSSLDASVEIFLDDQLFTQLKSINEELRFVLITSQAELKPLSEKPNNAIKCDLENDTVYIVAGVAKGEKCIRCWHKREEVGQDSKHPELCGRCITNIDGIGETRKYA